MELYIIRHASAEMLSLKNDFTDAKRALTTQGREKMRQAARGIKKLGVSFDLIMTSPLVRAVETAQIIGKVLDTDGSAQVETDNLAPGASFEDLFTEIRTHLGIQSAALIGHQPDLGTLISRLVWGSSLSIPLKKGGVCCISITETMPTFRGDIIWLMTPKQLRMMASCKSRDGD